MFVRRLFKHSSTLCYRQLKTSQASPLRLLPVASPIFPVHRRSYADITRNPRDKEILKICEQIRFIDAEGKYQGVHSLRYILKNFDGEKYHLICINPHVTDQAPTCKLISKEQLEEDEKAAYLAKKSKKHSSKDPSKVIKTIEISWATAPNDLVHKIRRMTEFLQRGNRVEIILGVKKGMAKQPLIKMEELVNQIKTQGEQNGKEWKSAEGIIGMQYMIYFEGIRPKVAKPIEEDPLGEAKLVEETKAIE